MIFNEDQQIKLGGVVLPGVVKSMEIKSPARIDEQKVEGSSAKPKQATGYEDAKITIALILDDTEAQTMYQRFAIIQNIFRSAGQTVPQPIPIVSEDTVARGISTVLFKELDHKRESKRDQLAVTLELWEYVPQTIKTQKSSGKNASSAGGDLSLDYKDYLSSDRGNDPTTASSSTGASTKEGTKNSKKKRTPARDTADTSKFTKSISRR